MAKVKATEKVDGVAVVLTKGEIDGLMSLVERSGKRRKDEGQVQALRIVWSKLANARGGE